MQRRTWRWAVAVVSVAAGAVVLAILLILLLPAPTSAPHPVPTPTPVITETPLSTPTATPTPTPTPNPGEVLLQIPSHAHPCADISATVAIGDVSGLQYGGFAVSYDPSVLEVAGVSDGDIGGVAVPAAGNWKLVGSGKRGQGELQFTFNLSRFTAMWVDDHGLHISSVHYTTGVDGSGSLCVIRFRVPCAASNDASTTISFSDNELYDYNDDPIPLTWSGGLFTVRQTPTPTPTATPTPSATPTATATPQPGEVLVQVPSHSYPCADISATVTIGDVVGLKYGGFKVVYDPALLEVTGVSDGMVSGVTVPAADNWKLVGSGEGKQGELRFSVDLVSHETGVDGKGSLCVIQFHVPCSASSGQDTDLSFSDNGLYDYNSVPIPLTWTGGLFEVRQTPTPTPTATPTPTPKPPPLLPDLVVINISPDIIYGYVNLPIYYWITVENQGAGDSSEFYVDAYADLSSPPIPGSLGDDFSYVGSLGAYESLNISFPVLLPISYNTPGEYKLWAQVDADQIVDESNESNNVYGPVTVIIEPVVTPTPTPTPTATATATPDVAVWIDFPDSPGTGDTLEADGGSSFRIQLSISEVYRLKVAQYDIIYDPAVLEISGTWKIPDVKPGKIGGQNFPVEGASFVPQKTQGRLRVIQNVAGFDWVSGSGFMSRVFFNVVGPPGSSSPIGIHIETLNDYALEPISYGVTNASVVVVEP